ncbi:MAG: hypothetical protein JW745_04115 [Sedimentisphaerales bacterium]|nr:hypothetical protein [Sedimentisphaerales bacterium]MBN2842794.1 hypothetical protein [Sedimentisphaerales bacterium]
MAKKQTMNLLEAHFEKAVIALAGLFLLWVLYANVINAPGAEINGQKVSAVEAAEKAQQLARDAVMSMSRPSSLDDLEEYKPVGDLLTLVEPLAMNEIPLSPPDISRMIMEQDIRDYTLPALPELIAPKLVLTHALASVPVENKDAQANPQGQMFDTRGGLGAGTEVKVKDVMFVSVEATFDMEKLYNDFEQAFTGQQVEKKLIDNYFPIVATVDLLRSELLEDGQWSAPVSVPRCKVDPMRNSLNATDMLSISKVRQNVAMKDNQPEQTQLMLIQPTTYNLIGDAWVNPSAKTEDSQNANRQAANPRGGFDLGRGGMMDIRGGMAGGEISTLKNKELKIWAHDDSFTPGKIYKYSIRLGIFNPCYETNWLTKSQADIFKSVPVLWTNELAVKDPVQTPPTSLFIPKAISDNQSARVEVYKFQNGQWFKRPFTVTTGEKIGDIVKLYALDLASTSTQQVDMGGMGRGRGGMGGAQVTADTQASNEIDVDFTMDAIVIEIKAPTTITKEVDGQTVTEISGEIIYKDSAGVTRSLTNSNAFWPDSFRKMQSDINRAFTADEKKRRDAVKAANR